MRAVAIVLIQVVLAVLVAGVAMPLMLVWVPEVREAGPLILVFLVVILFALLRLVWPASRRGTPGGDDGRRN